jgi:two-component system chemotaxis response regulator CheB
VVQNPEEATYPSMPQSALDNVQIDHVGSVAEIGALLSRLARAPLTAEPPKRSNSEEHAHIATEAAIAEDGQVAIESLESRGVPSAFACPDCHGVLWEVREEDLVRYRCRVGHAYLPQALAVAQSERLEESLWIALRTLKENSALSKRLAERARERKMPQMAVAYEMRAREAAQRAAVIEEVLKRGRLSATAEDRHADVSSNTGAGEP